LINSLFSLLPRCFLPLFSGESKAIQLVGRFKESGLTAERAASQGSAAALVEGRRFQHENPRAPAPARAKAAHMPAFPAPTTTTSYSFAIFPAAIGPSSASLTSRCQ
jgi:hypothetical protein